MPGDGKLAEFRSVERLEPTTVAIYPDPVVVAHGDADAAPRVVALTEIARVKVRAVFGIASLRLETRGLSRDGEARDGGRDVECLTSEGR